MTKNVVDLDGWRREQTWAENQTQHHGEHAEWAQNEAAADGHGRSPWVAEVLGDLPARKFQEVAATSAKLAGGWQDHGEKAASAIAHYERTEQESAAGLRMQVGDVTGPAAAPGSGQGPAAMQPPPGIGSPGAATTTTLQHGGTDPLPRPHEEHPGPHKLTPPPPMR